MPKSEGRSALEALVRRGARKLCISNDTVEWFLGQATPRQIDAVADMLGHELEVRGRNRRVYHILEVA